MLSPETAIDLKRYPVLPEMGAPHEALMTHIHQELDRDGCCVLKSFITPDAIDILIEEGDATARYGFHNSALTNPYFTNDDPALPMCSA